ncbi:MAG: hypothetical protein JNL82_39205 [Myxococcales bacterium]|nr:hypothetical protein [Myxococcales bacterium]
MTLTSPRTLTSVLALLLACGGDGGTSTTDSDTSASGSSSTGAPVTTSGEPSSGEPTTAGSVSESAEGSSTGASSTGDPGGSSTTAVSASGSTGDTGSTGGTTSGSTGGSTGDTTSGDSSTGEPGSSTSGAIDDCVAWQSAFDAEVLEIRGCDMDSECGQELQGTSCGCTRNWVARKDADVSEFWALVDKAGELGCDLPFFSTCDCPATDGFACEAGICTWNYT